MKKIISLLLCLLLIFSLVPGAFADEQPTTSITVTGSAPGAEFAFYKILNVSISDDGNGYGYTADDDMLSILQKVTGKTERPGIMKYLEELSRSDLNELAEELYQALVEEEFASTATGTAEKKEGDDSASVTVSDIPQGYYLIVETKLGNYGENVGDDSYSLHMVDTAGAAGLTVYTKESVPTLDKQVFETNDSTNQGTHQQSWGEHASYDIGDEIQFRIVVKVNSKFKGYETYYVCVEDTMDPGLTLNVDSIKVEAGGKDITAQFKKKTDYTDANGKKGFQVYADLLTISVGEGTAAVNPIAETHEFVVSYTATLGTQDAKGAWTAEAVNINAEGNKNTAKLIYQNKPYVEIDPENPNDEDLGETPKDTNVVFTFNAKVNKVDQDGKLLTGAVFTLYKLSKEDGTYHEIEKIGVGEAINAFKFVGLDEGIYKLEETTPPAGGYKRAEDLIFHVHAEYDTTTDPATVSKLIVKSGEGDLLGSGSYEKPKDPDDPEETGIESQAANNFQITLTDEKAEVSTTVQNFKGTKLPSTGGMGTTVLYIAGGILVLAAIVLLVTKKRMTNAE